jgi:hypothetical protein
VYIVMRGVCMQVFLFVSIFLSRSVFWFGTSLVIGRLFVECYLLIICFVIY